MLLKIKGKKKMPGEAATSTEQTGNNTTYILHDNSGGVKW
jgi:hypothetical protein